MSSLPDSAAAKELFDRGEYAEAIALYDRLCALSPRDPDLLFARGRTLLALGRPAEAADDFTRVLEVRPQENYARYNRGLGRFRVRNYAGAEADFNEFLRAVPHDAEGWGFRARCRSEQKDYARAEADFNRALELNGKLPWFHFHRGLLHQRRERWQAAVADYTRALQLDAAFHDSYFNRGMCHGRLGDQAAAVEDFSRYLDFYPQDTEAHVHRGSRRFDLGQYRRAGDDYRRTVKIDPTRQADLQPWIEKVERYARLEAEGPAADYAAACIERGWAKHDDGDNVTAAIWFNRALDVDRSLADAWRGRASARYNLEQYQESLQDSTRAIELQPTMARAWLVRAGAKRRSNDFRGSLPDYDRALELDPDLYFAYWGRAYARGELGEHEQAVEDWTRYLARDPDNADALANRGYDYGKLGRQPQALADYTRAAELRPQWFLPYMNRGYARKALGDAAGAIADFRRAVELEPSRADELNRQIDELARGTPAAAYTPPTPASAPVHVVSPAPSPTVPSLPAKPPLTLRRVLHGVLTALWAIPLGLVAVATILAFAACVIALFAFAAVKATDVMAATVYMVGHWSDPEAFPPGAQFCKKFYCRRTDTVEKHVAGRRGYTSEVDVFFCPDHEPAEAMGMLRDLGQMGGGLWFFYCLSVWLFVVLYYWLALQALPALLQFVGRTIPWWLLRSQFVFSLDGLKPLQPTLAIVAALLGTASCLMYAWW